MSKPAVSTSPIDAALLGDAPLDDPSQDLFGRAKFAERVAYVLAERNDPHSLVVGIYGKWGSGKTTVLNFIRRSLEKDHKDVITISFNPWRFSNEDELLIGFFDDFARELGKKMSPKQQKKLGRYVAKYGQIIVSGVGTFGSKFLPNKLFSAMFKFFADLAKGAFKHVGDAISDLDLDALKSEIGQLITDSDARVVVFVDDIDRLDRAEVQVVFRLVKLVADFDHVTYVLAFDQDVVAHSLGERYGEGSPKAGSEYLEKIIQVPLFLPGVKGEALLDICLEGIEEAARLAGIDLDTRSYEFRKLFENGLSFRLTTPRLAKRFGNSIVFTLPLLMGEVNTLDFVLLEGLRIFYPEVYTHIRDHRAAYLLSEVPLFYGAMSTTGFSDKLIEKYRDEREQPLKDFAPQEQQSLKNVLEYLFPRTTRSLFTSDWNAQWIREQRVTSPKYFERYFVYGLPEGDVSDVETKQFVASLTGLTADEIASILGEFLNQHNVAEVLRNMSLVGDTLDIATRSAFVKAIIRVGDSIQTANVEVGLMPVSNTAITSAERLLQGIPWGERKETIREIVEDEPIRFAAALLWWIAPQEGSRHRSIVEDQDFQQGMFDLIAGRIRGMVQTISLFDPSLVRQTRILLYCWRNGAAGEEVQNYLVEQFHENSENLIRFLMLYAPTGMTIGQGDNREPFIGDLERDHYRMIAKLLDPNVLQQDLDELYGKSVRAFDHVPDRYSDLPVGLRLAQQFTNFHLVAEQGKQDARQEADGVTEGGMLGAVSQEEIGEG